MKASGCDIGGLLIIEPDVFQDERGWFFESYNAGKLEALGIKESFVQDNHSRSVRNTLRGLHYQRKPGQSKIVRCTQGRIWDVAVDIRRDSATYGKWHAVELSEENKRLFYIPLGFAHGFCVLSDFADVQYKCSSAYDGAEEAGYAWDDPAIAIEWPVGEPILSQRDLRNPRLPR